MSSRSRTRHRERSVLVTAVLGVLCVAALGVATNVATSILPEAWGPHLWLAWPVVVLLIAAVVVLEVRRSRVGTEEVPVSNVRARAVLLERVHRYWIEGVLERSLYQQARIELGVEAMMDVVHPWDVLLTEVDREPRPLEPGTPVVTIFKKLDQAMLVLGAPGSGKTTMLLELLRDLLAAAADDAEPIPVMLNLSSWAQRREPLDEWVVREVSEWYQVSPRHVRAWLAADELVPLLDGLDEVAAQHREACAEAINAFRGEHGVVPIAVSCRVADYAELKSRVRAYGSLRLQPLTPGQVDGFLEQTGTVAEGARAALAQHPELRELMVSPLMLSILMLAFHPGSQNHMPAAGQVDDTTRLFQTFVATTLRRRPNPTCSPQNITNSLAFLARNMRRNSQTQFTMDHVDNFWLPSGGFSDSVLMRPLARLTYFSGLRSLQSQIATAACVLLALVGLTAGGYALFGWRGVILGGFVALAFGLSARDRIDTFDITFSLQHRDAVWVRTGVLEKWVFPLLLPFVVLADHSQVILVAAPVGVLSGFLLGSSGGWLSVIAHALAGAVAVLVAAGLSWGFAASLDDLPVRSYRAEVPGPKVRTVLRAGVLVAALVGAVVGGLCWLILAVLTDIDAWSFALLAGIGAALYALTCLGLYVAVEQVLTRRALRKADLLPLPARPLLDHACDCLFLNKVGDGYMFSHQLLLDFFSRMHQPGLDDWSAKPRFGA